MAKLYNLYDEDGPEVKIQNKMNNVIGNSLQNMANVAETSLGGAGLRKLTSPITEPLVAGRKRQKKYLSDKEINSMPDPVTSETNPHGQTSYQEPMTEKPISLVNQSEIVPEQAAATSGNWLRDESTGKTYNIDNAGRINGGPKPSRSEGRMGGYKLDGSRIIPSGKQGDQDALRTMGNREKQLKQYDYNEGLKSGRTQRPRNPMLGMKAKERIAYRNTQTNEANNLRNYKATMARDANTNTNAAERNAILKSQGLANLKPPASQVLTDEDMMGNKSQRIMIQRSDGTWVYGMRNPQVKQTRKVPKDVALKKLDQMRRANDPNLAAAEAEYAKYY